MFSRSSLAPLRAQVLLERLHERTRSMFGVDIPHSCGSLIPTSWSATLRSKAGGTGMTAPSRSRKLRNLRPGLGYARSGNAAHGWYETLRMLCVTLRFPWSWSAPIEGGAYATPKSVGPGRDGRLRCQPTEAFLPAIFDTIATGVDEKIKGATRAMAVGITALGDRRSDQPVKKMPR